MDLKSRRSRSAEIGGYARAEKYPPEQRSQWARRGGQAVLKKYGRDYFSRLRQKRDSQSTYDFCQKSPRQVAGAENGRIGGHRRAQLHGPQELSAWGRLGGLAVLKKHGNQHFRNIRAERTRKDKIVRDAGGFSVETRLQAEVAEQLQRLVQLIEYAKP